MDGGDWETLNENSPKEILEKLSPFPISEGKARSWWVMAMRHPVTSKLISAPFWFDMEHHNIIGNFVLGLDPADPDALLSVFAGRFGGTAIPPEMRSSDGRSALLYQPGRLTIQLPQVQFFLNEKGALCLPTGCAPRFQPIIEVPGLTGDVYIIDLRGLFFANPEFSHTRAFRDPKVLNMSDKEYAGYFFDDLVNDLNILRLSWRKKLNQSSAMTVEQGQAIEHAWTIKSPAIEKK